MNYNGGDTVNINVDTVITGSWTKTYGTTYPVTKNLEFYGWDVNDKSDDITAKLTDGVLTEAGKGQEVYLPKMSEYVDKKYAVTDYPNCVFGGWTVKNKSTGKSVSLKEKDGKWYFVMPDSEVTISGRVIRETLSWEAQSSGTNLATVSRKGLPFKESAPVLGKVQLEIYEGDNPSAVTSEFHYNYSADGYGCVDLDITPAEGYYIYKVDYTACRGKNGPELNGWKAGDKGRTTFTMDNVTDNTTVKIYLTKPYTVEYNLKVDGSDVSKSDYNNYVDNFPDSAEVFPYKVEAVIAACDGHTNVTSKYHDTCGDTSKHNDTTNTAKGAFLYTLDTVLKFPEITLKSGSTNQYEDGGDWTNENGDKISQGGSQDISALAASDLSKFVSGSDPYKIPLTINLKNAVPDTYRYEMQYWYEKPDHTYELRKRVVDYATNGTTLNISDGYTIDAGYSVSTKSHSDVLTTGTVSSAGDLILRQYYDHDDPSFQITFKRESGRDTGGFSLESSGQEEVTYIWKDEGFPSLPAVNTPDGFYFAGWTDKDNKAAEFPDSVTENLEYTAHWKEKIPYTTGFYFEQMDGSWNKKAEVSDVNGLGVPGEDVEAAQLNSVPLHYLEDDDKNILENALTGVLEEGKTLELKRYYKLDECTVKFLPGEHGEPISADKASQNVKYGSTINESSVPTASSALAQWEFDGWYPSGSNTKTDFGSGVTITEDIVYTARWKEKVISYKTEFYFEDLTGNFSKNTAIAPDMQDTGKHDETVSARYVPNEVLDKYEEDETDTNNRKVTGVLSASAADELVLRRNYKLKTYTVTLEPGSNSTQTDDVTIPVKHGGSFPTVNTPPAEDNYVFDGWYDEDGNKVEPKDFPTVVDKDITYTAHWRVRAADEADYKTQFYFEDLATGNYAADEDRTINGTGTIGTTITASLLTDVPEGYELFTGHPEYCASGTLEKDGLNLKVYYKLKEYNITFNPGSHSTQTDNVTEAVKHGGIVSKVPNPKPAEGYEFDGWADKDGNKVSEQDLLKPVTESTTYTAVWKEKTPGNIDYKTEFYFEVINVSGSTSYILDRTLSITKSDRPGTTVSAAELTAVPEGYEEDTANVNRIVSGNLREGAPMLTLRRYYKLREYSITFNPGSNGTLTGDSVITVKHGSVFPERPEPKPYDGYEFDGWYDESGNKITEFPSVKGNAVYTARWIEKQEEEPDDDDDEPKVTVPAAVLTPAATLPAASEAPDNPKEPEPSSPDSPDTGDKAPLYGTILAILAAGGILLYLELSDKKRKI